MAATDFLLAFVVCWVFCFLLFLIFPRSLRRPPPAPVEQGGTPNLLLVVAHPDDESMFFGPALLSLAAREIYKIRVLCLSNGNADGLGKIREAEMIRACCVLKVSAERVHILDHDNLQDGFHQPWKVQDVVKVVREQVTDHKISCILTFDKYGVSGHPNHIAVYHGVRTFLAEDRMKFFRQPHAEQPAVQGWELVSRNILRKYSGPLDLALALLERFWYPKERLQLYISPNMWTSIEAMKQHRSQWVWYRRLFVVFASYTYINTFRKMRLQ